MKLTLLGVVQSFLNKVGDVYVDSIFDSDISQRAALIAEEVYEYFVQKYHTLQYDTKLGQLDSVSDVNKPNYLRIPNDVRKIQEATISYNNTDEENNITSNYRDVHYLEPEQFLANMSGRSERSTNASVVTDFNGTSFIIYTDRHPSFCTTFDGEYLVFDSYDSTEDDSLQNSKSRALYSTEAVFIMEDDFTIPIPEHLSGLYRDMVVAECYEHILQQVAPPSTGKRVQMRGAQAQQAGRRTGSMNKGKKRYGRR